jgi:hypothetical protein
MLEGNSSSLECLYIHSSDRSPDTYLSAVERLQMNITLKKLRLDYQFLVQSLVMT